MSRYRGRTNDRRSLLLVLLVALAGVGGACAGTLTGSNDDPPQKQDCGDPCRANLCPKGARCTYESDTCHPVCEADYMRPPPEKLEPPLLSPPGPGLLGGVLLPGRALALADHGRDASDAPQLSVDAGHALDLPLGRKALVEPVAAEGTRLRRPGR